MAKRRNNKKNSRKRSSGMVKLKIVVEKLQKSLLLGRRSSSEVPEDVKEGHFAVIAEPEPEDGEGAKRFVVPLRCLTHPTFLGLLEEAAEEYGFDQEGAITIPCRPSQLETILADHQWLQEEEADSEGYGPVSWNNSRYA